MSRVPRLALLTALALPVAAHPGAPGPRGPLEPLRFLAGCWRGATGGGGTIEEHYTTPSANLILGMTRWLRDGSAVGYEFSTIAWEDSAVVLTPRPHNQAAVPFRAVSLDERGAAWENPEHDFPTRIAYRLVAADTLVARIEGPGPSGPRASEWRMARVRCGG